MVFFESNIGVGRSLSGVNAFAFIGHSSVVQSTNLPLKYAILVGESGRFERLFYFVSAVLLYNIWRLTDLPMKPSSRSLLTLSITEP